MGVGTADRSRHFAFCILHFAFCILSPCEAGFHRNSDFTHRRWISQIPQGIYFTAASLPPAA